MAHGMKMTDSAMYGSGKPAWHRHPNSRVVEGQPGSEDALRISGLDWLVDKEQITSGGIVIPGFWAVARQDLPRNSADRFLGVVQDRYQLLQNKEAVSVADKILEQEGGARFETLGSLWGGQVCYATIALPKVLKVVDDKVEKYLVLRWSHNGLYSFEVIITGVRVVCANTLRMAFNAAKQSFTLRHTASAITRIDEAKKILGLSAEYFDQAAEVWNSMAATAVDQRFVEAYLNALFPDPPKKEPKEGKKVRTNSRAANIRAEIAELYNGKQKGANMKAIKGTAWGLWSATTQYIDWNKTTHAHKGRSEDEARFDSTMFGSGARMRQAAFNLIARQTGIAKDAPLTAVS